MMLMMRGAHLSDLIALLLLRRLTRVSILLLLFNLLGGSFIEGRRNEGRYRKSGGCVILLVLDILNTVSFGLLILRLLN